MGGTAGLEEKYEMDNNVVEFAKAHRVGFCKVPENLDRMLSFSFFGRKFAAPRTIDLRDYCTPTEDQGSKPWCAAYAAAQWTENIRWRKDDLDPRQNNIDPTWIYQYAKSVDGDPHGDGTTLTAVLEALLSRNLFDRNVCRIRTINADRDAVKYAVHKFGCILGGFNVTDEWYELNPSKTFVNGKSENYQGGHAVLICGYNPDGVLIQNSWGERWGEYGFGLIGWDAFDKQFLYGSVLTNCLNGFQ